MVELELKNIILNNVNVVRQWKQNRVYFIIFDNDKEDPNKVYFFFKNRENINLESFDRMGQEWREINRIQLTYYVAVKKLISRIIIDYQKL